MFLDLHQQIIEHNEKDHYNIPDELLDQINEKALAQPADFEAFIQTVGFGLDSSYSIFIEAIFMRSEDCKEWEGLFFREIQRVVSAADAGDQDAIDELSVLMELIEVNTENKNFYTDTIAFLTSKLSSKKSEVREICMTSIFDSVEERKIELETDTILALHKLLKDEELKIRVETFNHLKSIRHLPRNFSFSLMEKMKARLFGYTIK